MRELSAITLVYALLGIEPRASCMPGKLSTNQAMSQLKELLLPHPHHFPKSQSASFPVSGSTSCLPRSKLYHMLHHRDA